MAEYTGREWKDHLEDTAGQVIQEGTPLSAKNLNEMEQGIKQANVTAGVAQKAVQETGVEITNIKKDIGTVTTQLADIVTDIKPINGSDSTALIQAALNKKGWVRIAKPGTYFISKSLEIDSNTFFELYPGVELKLKAGARTYLLVNKDMINGNENIEVKGGIWNTDAVNNAATGGYQNGRWPGHGIFMHKVMNLKFEGLFNKGCPKYCYMLVDIKNFIARNIGFDNNSDGFHFQPPIDNCFMENIWGHTSDDMISFTLGDYINYQVSNVGDFKNVHIRHVTCDNVKNVLKITGSGINNQYVFRNFTLEDVKGTVASSAVLIMDDAASNGTLANTKAYGITIKGVKTVGGSNPHIWIVPVGGGDFLVEDIQCETTGSTVKIGDPTASINNVTIKDLKIPIGSTRTFEILGSVKNVTLENIDAKGRAGHSFLKLDCTIDKLVLKNAKYYGDIGNSIFLSYGATSLVKDLLIDNCYIENVAYAFHISADATIKIVNSTFKDPISTPIFVASVKSVRIVGNSNSMDTAKTPFLAGTTPGTCSINDMSWKASYTKVNPQISDIFYNSTDASGTPTSPFKVGLVIWDGSKFKNLF